MARMVFKKFFSLSILFFLPLRNCVLVAGADVVKISEKELNPRLVVRFTPEGFGLPSPLAVNDKNIDDSIRSWAATYLGAVRLEGFEPVAVSARGGCVALLWPAERTIRLIDIDSRKLRCQITFYQDSEYMPLKIQFLSPQELGVVAVSRKAEKQEVSAAGLPGKLAETLRTLNLDLFSTTDGRLLKRIQVTEKGKVAFTDRPILAKRGVDELPCFDLSTDGKWLALGYADWVKVFDRSEDKVVLSLNDEQIPSPSGDKVDAVCFVGFSFDSEYLLVRRAWWTTCISLYDHTVRCSWLKTLISVLMKFGGVSGVEELLEYLEGLTGTDLIREIQYHLEGGLRSTFRRGVWSPRRLFVYNETTDPRTQPLISPKDHMFMGSDYNNLNILIFSPYLMEVLTRFNALESMCLFLTNDSLELLQSLGELLASIFTSRATITRIYLRENPNFLALSPGGYWLFAGGGEKNTRLIDLKYTKEHLQIVPIDKVHRAWFLRDGRKVLVMQFMRMKDYELDWGGLYLWDLGKWMD